jgi:hypothetical protein
MGHLHHATAHVNGRTNKAIDTQSFETDRSANDVYDRVERANLMKMNVLYGLIVYAGFCFGKTREDLHCTLLHRFGQRGAFNDPFDIR